MCAYVRIYLCTPPNITPCIWSPEYWLISGPSVGIASHSHTQSKPRCFRIFEKLVRPEIAPHGVAEHSNEQNGFVSIFYFWFCTQCNVAQQRFHCCLRYWCVRLLYYAYRFSFTLSLSRTHEMNNDQSDDIRISVCLSLWAWIKHCLALNHLHWM